jgi:hypothetical protein
VASTSTRDIPSISISSGFLLILRRMPYPISPRSANLN